MNRIGRLTRLAVLLAPTLVLSACVHVPMERDRTQTALSEAPAANAPFVSMDKGPFRDDPVPGQWWKLYDDPQLDGLIEEAFKANTDLRVAAANIDRASAMIRQAHAQGTVLANLNAGATVNRDPVAFESFQGYPLVSGGASLTYDFDVGGRIRSLTAAAGHDRDAAQAAYDLTRVNVAAGVAGAYADACAAGMLRARAQHSLGLLRRNLDFTNRLIAAGRGTPLDRDNAEVLVAQLEAQMPGFDTAQENALFRLATLLGRPPAEFPKEIQTCVQPPRVTSVLPVGDGAALLRRRPDVRAAERTVAGSLDRIGVARSELYPTVRFGASVEDVSPFKFPGTPRGFSFGLGPLLSWTFPNRKIAHAEIAAAEAERDAALARFDGVMLGALRETESALTTYAHELQRNASLREARDKAAAALAKVQRMRAAGRENALNGLDAARTLSAAEMTLATSDAALASDQVAVFLALGGGWQADGA